MARPNLDFYSTAAQVIPLLFITLAIDLRGFFTSPLDRPLTLWGRLRARDEPVRAEEEYRLRVAEAEGRQDLRLTPEEQFSISAAVQKSVAKEFDDAERPLARWARIGRVAAAVISAVAMIALIVGEAVALRVLEAGRGSKTASGIIESVLWFGVGLLAWRLLERVVDALADDIAWVDRCRVATVATLTGVTLAATYFAWDSF